MELRNSARFASALAAALQLASGDESMGTQFLKAGQVDARHMTQACMYAMIIWLFAIHDSDKAVWRLSTWESKTERNKDWNLIASCISLPQSLSMSLKSSSPMLLSSIQFPRVLHCLLWLRPSPTYSLLILRIINVVAFVAVAVIPIEAIADKKSVSVNKKNGQGLGPNVSAATFSRSRPKLDVLLMLARQWFWRCEGFSSQWISLCLFAALHCTVLHCITPLYYIDSS